jgi:hypothetical protein
MSKPRKNPCQCEIYESCPQCRKEDRQANQCTASVHDGGRSVSFHQCTRAGVLLEGGKHYCKTHAPSLVARKRAIQSAKWDREYALKNLGWDIKQAGNDVIEAALVAHAAQRLNLNFNLLVERYKKLVEQAEQMRRELTS